MWDFTSWYSQERQRVNTSLWHSDSSASLPFLLWLLVSVDCLYVLPKLLPDPPPEDEVTVGSSVSVCLLSPWETILITFSLTCPEDKQPVPTPLLENRLKSASFTTWLLPQWLSPTVMTEPSLASPPCAIFPDPFPPSCALEDPKLLLPGNEKLGKLTIFPNPPELQFCWTEPGTWNLGGGIGFPGNSGLPKCLKIGCCELGTTLGTYFSCSERLTGFSGWTGSLGGNSMNKLEQNSLSRESSSGYWIHEIDSSSWIKLLQFPHDPPFLSMVWSCFWTCLDSFGARPDFLCVWLCNTTCPFRHKSSTSSCSCL